MWRIENTPSGYGLIAVLFHWAMAALIIALSVLGLYMVRLPDVGFSEEKILLILFHKELGMLSLMLAALRWIWRLCMSFPSWSHTAGPGRSSPHGSSTCAFSTG